MARPFSDTTASTLLPSRDVQGRLLSLASGHVLQVYGDWGMWDNTANIPIGDQSADLVRTTDPTNPS